MVTHPVRLNAECRPDRNQIAIEVQIKPFDDLQGPWAAHAAIEQAVKIPVVRRGFKGREIVALDRQVVFELG